LAALNEAESQYELADGETDVTTLENIKAAADIEAGKALTAKDGASAAHDAALVDLETFVNHKSDYEGFVTATSDALADAAEALDDAGDYTANAAQNAALARAQTAFDEATACNDAAVGLAATAFDLTSAVD